VITLVNALASVVRKAPWVVIAVTLVITFVLGSFAAQFLPAEDQNASFAPDAPELTAAAEIAQTFGAESRMQVLTASAEGDVITLAGLESATALEEALRSSEEGDLLVDREDSPAVLSFLLPVQFAIQEGAELPTSDAEVKALYVAGLDQLPQEFRAFLTALVSDDADLSTGTAELGLTAITYTTTEDIDESARTAQSIADTVVGAPVPTTVTNDPFSVELIFASGEDFEAEILRLFASAGLIILLVLGIVFLVRPGSVRDRRLFVAGVALMAFGVAVAVVPALALIFPDVFPTTWGEVSLGSIMLTALLLYGVAFLSWTIGSRRLRRTTADTLLTFLTIGFAIQVMNGYGYLRFEDQSQMAQILPILLIGLGVDYSIHMSTRYRQEISEGRPVDDAMSLAIRTVGVALVLATLTTAVGFLTNITNELPALAEFGELAAVGIAASFFLMLTFVPAVRQLLDRRAERGDRLDTGGLETGDARFLSRLIGRTAVLPRKFAVATVISAIVVTGFGAYGMSGLSTEFSFLDFVPTTSPLRDTAVTLDERFDFPESTAVLVTGDVAEGSAWNALLVSNAGTVEVENVQSIETDTGARFPSGRSLTSVIARWIDPNSQSFDPALGAIAGEIGFDDNFATAPDADLTPLYDAAYEKDPSLMTGVLSTVDGSYPAALYTYDTTAGESAAADLASGLNDAFAPARGVSLESVATSNFIINNLIVVSLRDSQVSSLLLTLGAALLLLVVNFWFESRRPMLGVLTTIPVAMVVIWVFGLMAAFRIPFGPVTATISALGIGIGIPYMIHVTHRYLEERTKRPEGNEAIEQTLAHTGGALAGSAVTTMAGFGILMVSTTIPFRQFGFVLAYTILLALIAAVVVLPSMLTLWERWHSKRGTGSTAVDSVDAVVPRDA